MNILYSSSKKSCLLLSFLAATLLIFAYGCGRNPETVVVDFGKTVSIEPPEATAPGIGILRVAVGAMISPKETFVHYRQLVDYIGQKLRREVRLVQRRTYEEINELLGKGQIDLAFICSGPYAGGRERYGFEPLGTPVVLGSHFYQSYLIVNKDSGFYSLEDLREHVFAFTDPESNTGRLVPSYWTMQLGESPETFFSKTIYTYSHDNSMLAVARALVDGAAVDGLIWEYYHQRNPNFTFATRIIKKSENYGTPPVVASRYLEPEIRERIRQLLFSMHLVPEGQKILDLLAIDRFTRTEEAWYEPIRKLRRVVISTENGVPHVVAKP